jgi:hypothetical protein
MTKLFRKIQVQFLMETIINQTLFMSQSNFELLYLPPKIRELTKKIVYELNNK